MKNANEKRKYKQYHQWLKNFPSALKKNMKLYNYCVLFSGDGKKTFNDCGTKLFRLGNLHSF